MPWDPAKNTKVETFGLNVQSKRTLRVEKVPVPLTVRHKLLLMVLFIYSIKGIPNKRKLMLQ